MSIKIMSIIFDLPFRPKHKLIMLCLSNYANDDGINVYPSLKTIQGKTSLSRPAVVDAIRDLKEDGILIIESRGNVQRQTNRYRINVNKLVAWLTSKRDLLVNGAYQSLVNEANRTSKRGLPDPLDDPLASDPSVVVARKKTRANSKPPKAKDKPQKETCPKEWMTALYTLCDIDAALASPGMRKRISDAGKVISASGAHIEDIDRFKVYWLSDKWRRDHTPTPTPERVRDDWSKMNGNGNGHHDKPFMTPAEIERARADGWIVD